MTATSSKVLVSQLGARHRYSVPQMYSQLGKLSALYTDSYRGSILGKLASYASVFDARASRLSQRQVVGVPKKSIRSTDAVFVKHVSDKILGIQRTEINRLLTDSAVLSKKMISWGLPRGTTHVYTMFSENVDFVEWAAKNGMRCLVDIYTTPYRDQIYNQECVRLGLDHLQVSNIDTDSELKSLGRIVSSAAFLLCPSKIVAQAMEAMFPLQKDKIQLVPYASTLQISQTRCQVQKGQLLFVGQDPVRKGLFRLAEAVREIQHEGLKIQLRVAGEIPSAYTKDNRLSHCVFLGKLSREQLVHEFCTSEVLVLPSLAEGNVAAVSESVAMGCPVIISKECGADFVEDGKHGIVLETNSVDHIRQAIVKCMTDRVFRDQLAVGCRDTSAIPTLSKWKESLLRVASED